MITRLHVPSQHLAHGEETGRLAVFDFAQSTMLWSQQTAHQGAILALAWSADDASPPEELLLASGGQDGRICLWQAKSGTLLQVFLVGEPVEHLAWSTQGTLASIAGGRICLWERQPDHPPTPRRGCAAREPRRGCRPRPIGRPGALRQGRRGCPRPDRRASSRASAQRPRVLRQQPISSSKLEGVRRAGSPPQN